MKTNNRRDANASVTDNSKVGVILLPVTVTSEDKGESLAGLLDDEQNGGSAPANQGGQAGGEQGNQGGGQAGGQQGGEAGNQGGQGSAETAEQKAAREATEAANKAKQEQDKSLASKYGGVGLTANGDVIDSQGKVVKTKADVDAAEAKAKETATAVEIDGKKYKLNETGDALGEDGKVFKTKAELEALEAEDDEVPLVVEVIQKVGIHPLGEDGKPKVYEDSVEGFIQLANDIADIKAKGNEKKLFDTFPKVEKYLKHIASGGTDETFFNVVKDDFSKVVIDEKNVEQQKQIYYKQLIKRGIAPDKAQKTVQRSVDAGEILADSQDGLKDLQKMQSDEDARVEQENQIRVQRDEQVRTEHWKKVEGLVNTGNIKGIIIPEADRKAFYQYIAIAADDNGNSQAAIDRSKEDLETRLMMDFYMFKKYNLDSLVRDSANKERVKTLRSRMKKAEGAGGGSAGNGGGSKDEPVQPATDVTLESMLNQ